MGKPLKYKPKGRLKQPAELKGWLGGGCLMKKQILFIFLVLVSLSYGKQLAWSSQADMLKKVESMSNVVINKLDVFSTTSSFDLATFPGLFYEVEANRNIVGLESESRMRRFWESSAIVINGKKQYDYYNKWCFVVAQLIRNSLTAANLKSYVLAIRGPWSKQLFPIDYPKEVIKKLAGSKPRWDYHIVAIFGLSEEEFVLDPSHSNKAKLLGDYLQRFGSLQKLRLKRLKTNKEIDFFIHPIRGFRPRTMCGMPLGLDMQDIRIPVM